MSFGQFLFIFILIGLNAFFVSVEFAVVAARRSRLDLLASSDHGAAKLVRTWLENEASRDRLVSASQLGITVVSLALGSVSVNAFEALLAPFFVDLNCLPTWLSSPTCCQDCRWSFR
jgi:putative hemolysin